MPAVPKIHVLPVVPGAEHELSLDCWCKPHVDSSGAVVHKPAEDNPWHRWAVVFEPEPR